MKTVIYPGSFNPYHEGHKDVVRKCLKIFDKVIIAIGQNPDKPVGEQKHNHNQVKVFQAERDLVLAGKIEIQSFQGLLVDYINERIQKDVKDFVTPELVAVIRGLRDGVDLEFEKKQQYWNEDLGIAVPTIYVACDRNLVHISSSALRMLSKLGRK